MRLKYTEPSSTVFTGTKQRPIYQAISGGLVVGFRVSFADGLSTANNTSLDLHKNGVSILDAVISSPVVADYVVVDATLDGSAPVPYEAGDVLTLVISSSTGIDEGVLIQLDVIEE